METASRPIVYTFRFGGGGGFTTQDARCVFGSKLRSNSVCFSSRSYLHSRFCRKIKKSSFDWFARNSLSGNSTESNYPQKLSVLLEVEGVLIDVNRSANREAFNVAFKKLGLDCANWTEPIYSDLARKSAGDEERMLVLYFNKIGWPTSVATSEKGAFMKNVLRSKKNALDDLVMSKSFSLRPGVVEFIDDASKEGVTVIIIAAYDTNREKVARAIIEKLGADRLSEIKIIGDKEVKQSFYGQLVFGKGVSTSLDEQLAKEVSKAASAEKQRVAEEVASMLKLKVELNTSTSESLQNGIAALRAGSECAEVPIYSCILVAGSQTGLTAAERIGMPCVILRSSLTSRAEFPQAMAIMEGFGGADLTVSRLRKKLFS